MKKNIIKQLESLPFFTIAALKSWENLKTKALYENLQRWVRGGDLLRLKNGLYVTKTYVDRFFHDPSYTELIANKLTLPSYLSLDYVLQKKGMLTEATYTITSVTLKTTRDYQNRLGTFTYHHLHERLYFGFIQKSYGKNMIYEATLAKALFDFLYLRLSHLDPNDFSTLDELRLNWSQMDASTFHEVRNIIDRSQIKKMQKLIPLLKEAYHGNAYQRS